MIKFITKNYIIITVILIIIIALIIFLLGGKKMDIKGTTRFRLFYTKGYMMNADVSYEYGEDNGTYYMSIKPYLKGEEDTIRFEVDKSVIEEIEEVFNKYEVYKWDGFNKSDQYVLDGDSFSFSLYMNDKDISAHGYMKWPDNYGKVVIEVEEIFNRELNNRGE